MPITNDKSRKPEKNQSSSQTDDFDPEGWHEHVLAGIDPEKEAQLLRRTRERAKGQLGFSDSVLDKLYGLRSRQK